MRFLIAADCTYISNSLIVITSLELVWFGCRMIQERDDQQRSVQQLTERYKNAQMELVKVNLQVPVPIPPIST